MSRFFGSMCILSTLIVVSCGPGSSTSTTQDIFAQDLSANGNDRRRPANNDEKLWTINMSGCTGHLIAPEVMMTAAHCSPYAGATYQSGASIISGGGRDITVTEVAERNSDLDYAILRIRWQGQRPANQKFPASLAHQKGVLAMGGSSGQGDEIFTVGFPGDKMSSWGATFAQGRAKRENGNLLQYNIGIINGNSGGGVWRKSDGMLVSLTNGGPNNLGQGGWSGADASDSGHWNHGAAMWHVYSASRVIKEIFPNGKNKFAEDVTPPGGSKDVFVALGKASNGAVDTYDIFASAATEATSLVFCQSDANCGAGAAALTNSSLDRTKDDRKIFKLSGPLALQNGKEWYVVAKKADGSVLASRKVKFEEI